MAAPSSLSKWTSIRSWHHQYYWYLLVGISALAEYDWFLSNLSKKTFHSWCPRGEVSCMAWNMFLALHNLLGFVDCRATSKTLGIVLGEHAWSDVKQIMNGKRYHLTGNSLEKREILFTTANLEEAWLLCNVKAFLGDMFGDDDIG